MRAQGRRWLRLVHKLIRPAADTVERMQKGAYKVDSKNKIACHETDKPLCNSEGAASLNQCYNILVESKNVGFSSGLERLRYPMQVKGQAKGSELGPTPKSDRLGFV